MRFITTSSWSCRRWWQPWMGVTAAVLLLLLPSRILWEAYAPGAGFLRLIHFAESDRHRQLPALATLPPQAFVPSGYDGQFYAQIALCPGLQCPELSRVIDNPVYRARRIGQPALAWLGGAGRPYLVLQVYALINVLSWMALWLLLARFVGFRRPRDVFLALALLGGMGSLTSLARALPDLPAAVLSIATVWLSGKALMVAGLLAGGALFKETTALSYLAGLPPQHKFRDLLRTRTLVTGILMVLPLALWLSYVYKYFPSGAGAGIRNFALPFTDLLPTLADVAVALSGIESLLPIERIFHLLSLPSLAIQAIYLIVRPQWGDRAWFVGFGFALLLPMLGSNVLSDAHAYTRVLLPMTFAFNVLIHKQERGWTYLFWLIVGNIGLTTISFDLLLNLLRALIGIFSS